MLPQEFWLCQNSRTFGCVLNTFVHLSGFVCGAVLPQHCHTSCQAVFPQGYQAVVPQDRQVFCLDVGGLMSVTKVLNSGMCTVTTCPPCDDGAEC